MMLQGVNEANVRLCLRHLIQLCGHVHLALNSLSFGYHAVCMQSPVLSLCATSCLSLHTALFCVHAMQHS